MILRAIHPAATVRAIGDFLRVMVRHRELIAAMAKRDIGSRFAGQVLGSLWAVLHPLVLICVYIVLFAFVFNIRMPEGMEFERSYTTYLLSGLVPWIVFQEIIIRSSTAVTENDNLVKQVVFPIEVLPVKSVLSSMVVPIVAFTVLLLQGAVESGLPAIAVLLPLLLLLQLIAMVGIAMLLAAVGVYLRDLKDIAQVGCFITIYATPIFYLPDWVPSGLKPITYLNPFSYMVWCYRDLVYYGRFEHPWAWLVFTFFALLSFAIGYRVFRRLKPGFGSVL